jgi:hypothetical protein
MALVFSIAHENVPFANGSSIDVRGLNLPDFTQLTSVHWEQITALYDKYAGEIGPQVEVQEIGNVLLDLIHAAPGVISHVIVLAGDLPASDLDQVSKIPVGSQVKILQAIFDLTFAADDAGNVLAAIGVAARAARDGNRRTNNSRSD